MTDGPMTPPEFQSPAHEGPPGVTPDYRVRLGQHVEKWASLIANPTSVNFGPNYRVRKKNGDEQTFMVLRTRGVNSEGRPATICHIVGLDEHDYPIADREITITAGETLAGNRALAEGMTATGIRERGLGSGIEAVQDVVLQAETNLLPPDIFPELDRHVLNYNETTLVGLRNQLENDPQNEELQRQVSDAELQQQRWHTIYDRVKTKFIPDPNGEKPYDYASIMLVEGESGQYERLREQDVPVEDKDAYKAGQLKRFIEVIDKARELSRST